MQTILTLKRARQAVDGGSEDVAGLIEKAVVSTERANEELRELAAAFTRSSSPLAVSRPP